MINTASLFSCFGDIIELNFEPWDTNKYHDFLVNHPEWKRYNYRKNINRFGLSVISMDGGYSGVPDLDSLIEYNKETGKNLGENDFKTKTPIVEEIPELKKIINYFGDDVGRSHFLKLNLGGFFPPHRDNGTMVPSQYFRIIVPLINTNYNSWKWLHENKVKNFQTGKAYCVNTTKEHCIFSFTDNCIILVLNVKATIKSIMTVTNNLAVY